MYKIYSENNNYIFDTSLTHGRPFSVSGIRLRHGSKVDGRQQECLCGNSFLSNYLG